MRPDVNHIYRPETHRRAAAVVSIALSAFLFAVMGLCTKATRLPAAGHPLPASEVTLFRFLFGLLVMLPLLRHRSVNLLGDDRKGLIWRGIYGGLAVYFYFLSLQHTTLTHAVLLNYTSIIFTPLCAYLFLGERLAARTGISILIAVVGILLVTRPESGPLRAGDLYGLLSGLFAGQAITSIRRLRQTETSWSIFFYFSLIGLPISLLGCLFEPPVWPTVHGWLLLLGMAVSSVVAQILMTFGLKYVTAAEGVVLALSQILYSALAGAVLFSEPLTLSTLTGGLLIMGAGLWMSFARPGEAISLPPTQTPPSGT